MKREPGAAGQASSPPRSDPRVADFLADLANARRLSGHTCVAYARDIARLFEVIGATPLERLQAIDIRRAVAKLHGRGLDGRSIARMLSAWRSFYRWLAKHHGFKLNPCEGLRAPKSAKRLPDALSPDAVSRLLEGVAEDAQELRDKAMFELFYSSGLRLAELVGLDAASARGMRADAEVTVVGKGRKTRSVPVGRKALDALAGWLEVRAQLARPDEGALFVGARGERISPRVVQARLSRWRLKQGVDAKVHPHVLRHSFASHVLQSSGDLRAVQEMLGHASISTTQVYTHLDFQHLAKAYDAAHPRAKKKS